MTKDFGLDEKSILHIFNPGLLFSDGKREYEVNFAGKPTCRNGEPKTDIYISAKQLSTTDLEEFKISYKKPNADFLENKISAERAKGLLGNDWSEIITRSTLRIRRMFEEKPLIYKNNMRKTRKGAITLGWKFELVNKVNGALSGELALSSNQIVDIYSGTSLPEHKRNAFVNGTIVNGSGIADYLLTADPKQIASANDVMANIVPINSSDICLPPVYFACKALNYRTFEKKHDGNRPLCVYVNWSVEDGKLKHSIVFDNPLLQKGDVVQRTLANCLAQLGIETTDDINSHNVWDPRIIHF